MKTELITNWADYDYSFQQILALATKTLCLFDDDLSKLNLESPERAETLKRFVRSAPSNSLQIIVRNADYVQRYSPRLMKLLADNATNVAIYEYPLRSAPLNDSMFIADERHILVRFHKDNVRSKTIINSPQECLPYVQRFKAILAEDLNKICATPLGL